MFSSLLPSQTNLCVTSADVPGLGDFPHCTVLILRASTADIYTSNIAGLRLTKMVIRERTRGVSHRVGLDIGSHSVRGVEVMEHGSELVIRSAGSAAVSGLPSSQESPDDSSVVQAIRNLWASARFETNKVALALPSEAAHMKWLSLEPSDGEELDAIARATAARGAPFPAEDAVLDYRVLSSGASGSRTVYSTMLVAVSSSALDHLLNLAERAGLETIGVDLGIPAALRSFEAQERVNWRK